MQCINQWITSYFNTWLLLVNSWQTCLVELNLSNVRTTFDRFLSYLFEQKLRFRINTAKSSRIPQLRSEISYLWHNLYDIWSSSWYERVPRSLKVDLGVLHDFFAYYFGGEELPPLGIQAWIDLSLQGRERWKIPARSQPSASKKFRKEHSRARGAFLQRI